MNATFNMKREAINEAEAAINEDILYPAIDTMLICRQNALEKVNKMYGTNITVDFDSVWAQNAIQEELALDYKKAEIVEMEGKTDENDRNPVDRGEE